MSVLIIVGVCLVTVNCSQGPHESETQEEENIISFYIGETQWDPVCFSSPPDWAPIEMDLQVEENTIDIFLESGETRSFRERWDFTNYDGEPLKSGTYLVYAGIEGLNISENREQSNKQKLYDDDCGHIGAGTGAGPDTLVIE